MIAEEGRLYRAIYQAGFSFLGFARRMGVHRTTVWRIDRGDIRPSEDWLMRAAALLGVDVADLVDEPDHDGAPVAA